jgi:hypothetical protein
LIILLKQVSSTHVALFHVGDKWLDDILYSYLENLLLFVLAEPVKELIFRDRTLFHSIKLSKYTLDLKVGQLVIDKSRDQSLELWARHRSTSTVLIVNEFWRNSGSIENLSDPFN